MKTEIRIKIYNKYNAHCAYCGEVIKYKDMHIDHIHPKRKEHWLKSEPMKRLENILVNLTNIDDRTNLNPACRSCNISKGTLSIEKFRERLISDVDGMRRDSAKFRILERFRIIEQRKMDVRFYFEEKGE